MEIIQEIGKSYLCVDVSGNKECEYMERMLTDNIIKGQPVCRRGIYQNKDILKFDITNMKTLRREFENRSLYFEDLKWLLCSIASQLTTGSSYLLEEEYYLYDPDHIYIDMESDVLNMICIPYKCEENSAGERYHSLADFLLEKIEHKDEHAVSIAYQFYRMSKESLFSIIGFCSLIEKETGILSEKGDRNKEKTSFITPGINDEQNEKNGLEGRENYEKEDEAWFKNINSDKLESNDGKGKIKGFLIPMISTIMGTAGLMIFFLYGRKGAYGIQILSLSVLLFLVAMILFIKQISNVLRKKEEREIENGMSGRAVTVGEYWGGDDNTVFFDEETQFFNTGDLRSTFSVVWNENGEERKEVLGQNMAILGKKYDEVDVCVSDPTVSRKHAKLTVRMGDVYLQDLGSTNGTFVDGKKLDPGEDIKLCNNKDFILGKVALRVV